jgi:hypothetical protein
VLRRDNGSVLYFAARSRTLGLPCIGAATAQGIEGTYTSPDPEPLVCQPDLGGSIDPQPFVDNDGTAYLLCKGHANAIGQTSTQRSILATMGDEAGAGGASMVTGPGGDHWLAYHAWTRSAIGYHNEGARSLRFPRLTWDANQLVVAARREDRTRGDAPLRPAA